MGTCTCSPVQEAGITLTQDVSLESMDVLVGASDTIPAVNPHQG